MPWISWTPSIRIFAKFQVSRKKNKQGVSVQTRKKIVKKYRCYSGSILNLSQRYSIERCKNLSCKRLHLYWMAGSGNLTRMIPIASRTIRAGSSSLRAANQLKRSAEYHASSCVVPKIDQAMNNLYGRPVMKKKKKKPVPAPPVPGPSGKFRSIDEPFQWW